MKKYCWICGKKLIKGKITGYDDATGEPDFKMNCPDEKTCSHGHHNFKQRKFVDILVGQRICKDCGETFYVNNMGW